MSSADSTPLPQLDSQDNEAAGLLMLFSTQSQKLAPTNSVPQQSHMPIAPVDVTHNTYLQAPEFSVSKQVPEQNAKPSLSHTSSSSSNTPKSAGHRRQSSNSRSQRIDGITRSPGPAAAALASGDSSNKAIVAAAALAAAAATPLPVVHKTESNPTVLPSIGVKKELEDTSAINVKEEKRSRRATADKKDERSESRRRDDRGRDTKHKTKTESKKASPPPYAVGPDAGIISCMCGYDHDDGLTIQCDKCFRWQHLICMGFNSIDDTPDDFQCNLCNKNLHVDEQKAKKLQENYLKEEKSKRKRSPYVSDTNKDSGKNVGAAQFKKKKGEDQDVEEVGVNKYKTLYFPVNYFAFKSSQIKAIFNQLPESLRKDPSILKVERLNLNRLILNSSNLNLRNPAENAKVRFTGVSKLGLYSLKHIREGTSISLMHGEVDTKQNYMTEKVNKYWLLGCPKPNVYFHPSLPIVVDQRGLGNFTRFIRKACKPNCEMRTILINKNEIGIAVFTTKDIKPDQELTLPWEWDTIHPILKMINEDFTFDQFEMSEKITIINSVLSILDLTDCACTNSGASDCVINKIKKCSTYMQRSARKANLQPISPTPNQKHVPIQQRLEQRQTRIMNGITHDLEFTRVNDSVDQIHGNDINNINNDRSDSTNSVVFLETETAKDQRYTDRNTEYLFKPKVKSTLYNIHILPKQYELMKKYSKATTPVVTLPVKVDASIKSDIFGDGEINEKSLTKELPIPVEINPEFIQKMSKSVSSEVAPAANGVNSGIASLTVDVQDRPKVKKKFSLADYKKKKTV